MAQQTAYQYLSIKNKFGSVEHYYHFLLGFLLPLVEWYTTRDKSASEGVRIRSCAIMDPLIRELELPGIEITPNNEKLESLADKWQSDPSVTRITEIEGFDHPSTFGASQLRRAAHRVRLILAKDVEKYHQGSLALPFIKLS